MPWEHPVVPVQVLVATVGEVPAVRLVSATWSEIGTEGYGWAFPLAVAADRWEAVVVGVRSWTSGVGLEVRR